MRFRFIDAEKAHYPVSTLCRVLQVSRSGFYDWRMRAPDRQREALYTEVKAIHKATHETYGSRRMAVALQRKGFAVGRYQARSLMHEAGVEVRKRRPWKAKTDRDPSDPVAENLLQRAFAAQTASTRWVADITALWTHEGWTYLAAVLDLPDRRIKGWAMAGHMRTELAEEALEMAVRRHRPPPGLLHHSLNLSSTRPMSTGNGSGRMG